jgi:hypothetical protein
MPNKSVSRERVVERLVAWIWQQGALRGSLPGDDGREYQVVFRGRGWGERGADFQGAIVARDDGVLLKGDVELHVRASDWRRHGHHRDRAYDATVCHVVLWDDGLGPARRADGQVVPTLELINCLTAPLAELEARMAAEVSPRPVESACVEDASELDELLDRAGLERFLEKSARFQSDLGALESELGPDLGPELGPDELLYRGALRAMGYTANVAGFEAVGEALSLVQLRLIGQAEARQAALLGVGGLLPGQRGLPVAEGMPARLEASWRELGLSRSAARWQTWRVRPLAAPARRAAGFAALIDRRFGVDEVALDVSRDAGPARLVDRWRVDTVDEFWRRHLDFDAPVASADGLIGRHRAAEVVVNVALPLVHAVAEVGGDARLAEQAIGAYRRMPGTTPNRVVAEMARQLGGDGARVVGAARQQGLIHLYKRWCRARECAECAAGAPGQGTMLTLNSRPATRTVTTLST